VFNHPCETVKGLILLDYSDAFTARRIQEMIDAGDLEPLPPHATDEGVVAHWVKFILRPGVYGTEATLYGLVGAGNMSARVFQAAGSVTRYLPGPDTPANAPEAKMVRFGNQEWAGHYDALQVR
jgi:hypothetical protein